MADPEKPSDNLNEMGIFSKGELEMLGAEASLGDAIREAGFQIMSPEDLDTMFAEADDFRRAFPFALSIDGFSIPRPDTWIQTSLDADEPQPSVEELVGALTGKKRHTTQLSQRSFASLDEAITVAEAYPRHDFYWDLDSTYSRHNANADRSESASIVGATVVRLLIPSDIRERVASHERIDSEVVYPIYGDSLWGYDFARAAEGKVLKLFVPEPKFMVPKMDRSALHHLLKQYYIQQDGSPNDFALNRSKTNPERIISVLSEDQPPKIATSLEVTVGRALIGDILLKAAQEGAGEEELAALRQTLNQRLFPAT